MDAELKEGKVFVNVIIEHGDNLPNGEYYTINKRSRFSEFDEEVKRIALVPDETLIYCINQSTGWFVVEMCDYYEKLSDGDHVLVKSKTLTKERGAICGAEPCCIL